MKADPAVRTAFIRTHTALMPVPHAPEIKLYLAHEALELWQKTEEELEAIGLPPPFWAFAWAGGQALARYILDHPHVVAGKRVFDLASGSGLVAIAAAMAGARQVIANEIDDFALAAIAANAQANGVAIDIAGGDMIGRDDGWDVVLAGDISYERDMAARMTDWLSGLRRRGCAVLIGDPGRSYLAREQLVAIAEYQVPVTRALEDTEVKRTSVWRFRSD
ncbi:MAG: nicotinamide N-methyase [Rhizobiales bacterium 62-17]|nr:methyltransferase [Hyphomicrobiales bacterium]OJX99597.1 MAG: nicotinamide N-methyase [Rhizobiales bacterium 62-17]